MIRRAEQSDVEEIVALVRGALAEFDLTFGVGAETDAQIFGLPHSYDGGAFFVARDGAKLLGCAGMFPVAPRTLELRKMYLDPTARGRGVGDALWRECLAFAHSVDARHIVLDTMNTMTTAIAFYEKRGFVRDDGQLRGARCQRGYRLDL